MSTARLRAQLMLSPWHCGAVTATRTEGESKALGNILFFAFRCWSRGEKRIIFLSRGQCCAVVRAVLLLVSLQSELH